MVKRQGGIMMCFLLKISFYIIMKVKSHVFNQSPYPNWTAVGVNWLAGFDFEIKVTARIPKLIKNK